jgi:hypothetical protein
VVVEDLEMVVVAEELEDLEHHFQVEQNYQ